jgi:hypothetical protein
LLPGITMKIEHLLTEHVNSFSKSPCTPLFRSPSAIATRIRKQPEQGRSMPKGSLAVTS